MVSPLVLFVAVFGLAFVLQILIPTHRILVAVATTVLPVAMAFSTVWWRIWDRDALWIIGFAMVFLECTAASVVAALAAERARRAWRAP